MKLVFPVEAPHISEFNGRGRMLEGRVEVDFEAEDRIFVVNQGEEIWIKSASHPELNLILRGPAGENLLAFLRRCVTTEPTR